MDRFDRIFRLHQLLSGRRTILTGADIEQQLECSRATRNRCIEDMRDHLGAPIVFDQVLGGYRYDTGDFQWELPGLWFQPQELQALLVMQQLMRELQPGLLSEPLAPVQQRFNDLLEQAGIPTAAADKIAIFNLAGRPVDDQLFAQVVQGLFADCQLQIDYQARSSGESTQRRVSPLKMVYYRSNWYLDGWCHLRDGLRSFSLDAISNIELTDVPIAAVDPELQLAHFGAAYGIFSGPADQLAVIEFSVHRARWVANEQWHPEQQGEWLADGRYRLTIPYGDPRELIMDILKQGAGAEVISPLELRQRLLAEVNQIADLYGPNS
ncbi:MAG: YafY family transcriptional regulator [Immundisolibacteraceae bacterium]|nr:YafY family transcriptional regulator [Immundisolibacteraceae bacterium]